MEANLTFQYDRDADILYVNTCPPYPEQESEELADEIIARFIVKSKNKLTFQRVAVPSHPRWRGL